MESPCILSYSESEMIYGSGLWFFRVSCRYYHCGNQHLDFTTSIIYFWRRVDSIDSVRPEFFRVERNEKSETSNSFRIKCWINLLYFDAWIWWTYLVHTVFTLFAVRNQCWQTICSAWSFANKLRPAMVAVVNEKRYILWFIRNTKFDATPLICVCWVFDLALRQYSAI